MANHGDWQFGIYFNGLVGQKPSLPMEYASLERAAEAAMSDEVWSYVAGGAGNEHTQRSNVTAFERWGLMPRMLAGAAERDLGVELFGQQLPTPLMLAPVPMSGLSCRFRLWVAKWLPRLSPLGLRKVQPAVAS